MTQAEHVRAAVEAVGEGDDAEAMKQICLAFPAAAAEIQWHEPDAPLVTKLYFCCGEDCPGLYHKAPHPPSCSGEGHLKDDRRRS